jgi:hypothetical protein
LWVTISFIPHNLHQIQRTFFPDLIHEAGPIPETLVELSYVVATLHAQKVPLPLPCWTGRPPKSRRGIFNAFISKAFLKLPTTLHLVERLQSDRHLRLICGFASRRDVPSESVFSRVFSEFARTQLPQRVHEALIARSFAERIVGHIARDSTSIEAREKPEKKEKTPKSVKRKGRPRKGENFEAKEPTRIQKQMSMSLEEMLNTLPTACNVGSKKNSQGYIETWIGYKLHIDTADNGLPISAVLTSASLHDSQAAIPLATMTAKKVQNLYDLMDSAYDVPEIEAYSKQLNHVPLIDINPRRNAKLKEVLEAEGKARKALNWKPAEAIRYNGRSVAERANARLKDDFGGRMIRVRGNAKVFCHIMLGILVLTVDQLMKLAR